MSKIKSRYINFGTGDDSVYVSTRVIPANFTPTVYTPVQVSSEGSDKLSAHLKGIDQYLSDLVISGGDGILGLPSDLVYGGSGVNISGVSEGDTVEDAFDKVETILGKLAPAKPPNLSTRTLAIAGVYSAYESVSGTLRTNVVDSTTPEAPVSGSFYDGDTGTLTAYIDSSADGSKALTTSSDVGTYTSLKILTDADYYAGQAGKENFWKALTASVKAASSLSVGVHTYQLTHSITGSTPTYTFSVDNPQTPSVTSQSLSTAASGRYVSGVPGLNTGDTITADFTVQNAIYGHYNSTRIAAASSSYTNSVNDDLPGTPPNSGDNFVASISLTVASSKYTESASVTCTGYNSKGTTGTANATSSIRIDSVSNESARKTSGTGQFPTTYGDTFDSSASIVGNEELQMLNGSYQFPPQVNYSGKVPSGPDYSSISGGSYNGMRWVTFNPGSISSATSLTVTINGSANLGSNKLISGFAMYVKIVGASGTGWVDGNAAYPGVGSPVNDGDAAFDDGQSTVTTRKITFGSTARTGQVWIRIGIPSGTKSFSSITLS